MAGPVRAAAPAGADGRVHPRVFSNRVQAVPPEASDFKPGLMPRRAFPSYLEVGHAWRWPEEAGEQVAGQGEPAAERAFGPAPPFARNDSRMTIESSQGEYMVKDEDESSFRDGRLVQLERNVHVRLSSVRPEAAHADSGLPPPNLLLLLDSDTFGFGMLLESVEQLHAILAQTTDARCSLPPSLQSARKGQVRVYATPPDLVNVSSLPVGNFAAGPIALIVGQLGWDLRDLPLLERVFGPDGEKPVGWVRAQSEEGGEVGEMYTGPALVTWPRDNMLESLVRRCCEEGADVVTVLLDDGTSRACEFQSVLWSTPASLRQGRVYEKLFGPLATPLRGGAHEHASLNDIAAALAKVVRGVRMHTSAHQHDQVDKRSGGLHTMGSRRGARLSLIRQSRVGADPAAEARIG
mmetsp:Transcript_2520/g.6718  ORF Transcript_2520/g.6718 Transcript_2520/m.6718 type:complete len:408 (-) Transcript_2520:144-1367(-)